MKKNLYEELGLKKDATKNEIKSSYRSLVKKHHPDAGGEKDKFLKIQNAWEILNDPVKKANYDKQFFSSYTSSNKLNDNWEKKFNSKKFNSSIKDKEVETWMKEVYIPINRLITQIIKPLNNEIKELAGDPYDDELMENFVVTYNSQKKMRKVDQIYNKKLFQSLLQL